MLSEQEYRERIQQTFKIIENAFEDVDPDIAECENSFGALVITLADRTKCILSAQPSVRQLWLALAAKGVAYHFNWDAQAGRWMDDKGKGIEVLSFLQKYFQEIPELKVRLI